MTRADVAQLMEADWMDQGQTRPKTGLRQRMAQLKVDTYALYLAYQDDRVPWYAKVLLAGIVAYTVSPIDLIPDFIPVLGYLDDLVLVPLGIRLALKLIPTEVFAEHRARAEELIVSGQTPTARTAAAVVIFTWIVVTAWVIGLLLRAAR
jgi:uncharacterized membrane protein YkvA (DUF1232 family)